jgi:hypothetical protein
LAHPRQEVREPQRGEHGDAVRRLPGPRPERHLGHRVPGSAWGPDAPAVEYAHPPDNKEVTAAIKKANPDRTICEALGYVVQTTGEARNKGNWSGGHEYGTGITEDERRELLEYLKTL